MTRRLMAIMAAAALALSGAAQPPAKQPPYPPVAPAQARLDVTLGGLDGPGFAVASDGEGGRVAVACEGGAVQLWGADALLGIRGVGGTAQVLRGHDGPVTALAWNGGPVLASAGAGKIVLWSAADGKPLHTLPAERPMRALAMSPDGKLVASAGDDPVIRLWDVQGGKAAGSLEGHTDWVQFAAFSGDGKLLVSGGYDGAAILWDVAAGKKMRDLPAPPSPAPKEPPEPVVWLCAAFAPDGKTLALGGSDGPIRIVNIADGKVLRALGGHTGAVTGVAFHPDGKLLASSSKDRTVRLWDPNTAAALKALEGHAAWAQGVAFFARGTRVASVGADQTVRVWDLTELAKK